ncbi:vasodilator-stimulated phosphoprotein-like, partial [Melozone crissalis]|uniref:vasodilator-stimulated phosphoprotein-like n=1 Tax=Melozone crissalis TaxID=40204 RepID=UPI0023DCB526
MGNWDRALGVTGRYWEAAGRYWSCEPPRCRFPAAAVPGRGVAGWWAGPGPCGAWPYSWGRGHARGGGASRRDRRVRPPPRPPHRKGPDRHGRQHERALSSARAVVLLYDEAQKLWVPAGGVPAAPSCVQLFHQPGSLAFRIVGRRLPPEQQVVLNCPLCRGLRYSQATPQFHQWREGRRVWGLSFSAPPEAAQFAAAVLRALQAIERGPPWPGRTPMAPPPLSPPT